MRPVAWAKPGDIPTPGLTALLCKIALSPSWTPGAALRPTIAGARLLTVTATVTVGDFREPRPRTASGLYGAAHAGALVCGPMDAALDAVVLGAGPAGLAVAACLRGGGSSFEVIERAHRLAESWYSRYDSLRLHTDKRHSELPGMTFPNRYPRYVPRDQYLDYLEAFAQRFDIHPRCGEEAVSARRVGDSWELQTASTAYRARNLVVATGHASRPNLPDWPGLDSFDGPVVHSSRYRNPLPYAGKRVLVVGFGSSGGEIAKDLYGGGARTTLSVRGPVNLMPRQFLGIPLMYMAVPLSRAPAAIVDATTVPMSASLYRGLKHLGFQKLPYGPFTQAEEHGQVPVIDTGIVSLLRKQLVSKKLGVARIDGDLVVFDDGSSEQFDALILATGYKPSASLLFPEDPALFDGRDLPRSFGGKPAAEGLFFCGFHVVGTGMLREISLEAREIADRIKANTPSAALAGS